MIWISHLHPTVSSPHIVCASVRIMRKCCSGLLMMLCWNAPVVRSREEIWLNYNFTGLEGLRPHLHGF